MKKILLIDNYDSFAYNLKHLILKNFGGKVVVKRNDKIDLKYVKNNNFDCFIISPGPKTPSSANISNDIIKKYYNKKPILGVCLGMQCINEFFGGQTIKADIPVHGKTSEIKIENGNLFKNFPHVIKVARYHSLICRINSNDLLVTSKTFNNVPMSIEHKKYPIYGVQFHPESFMTENGDLLIKNFLKIL